MPKWIENGKVNEGGKGEEHWTSSLPTSYTKHKMEKVIGVHTEKDNRYYLRVALDGLMSLTDKWHFNNNNKKIDLLKS